MQTLINASDLEKIGYENGLDAFGVAKADQFKETLEILKSRKAQGLHGGMNFTYRNPVRSTTPKVTMPDAQSLIVGARSYWKPNETVFDKGNPPGREATYAQEKSNFTFGVEAGGALFFPESDDVRFTEDLSVFLNLESTLKVAKNTNMGMRFATVLPPSSYIFEDQRSVYSNSQNIRMSISAIVNHYLKKILLINKMKLKV